MGNSPVLRGFYRKYLCSEKYVKYRKYAPGGKGVSHFATPLTSGSTCAFSALMVSLYLSAAAGQALTCPPWCIRTPPCCPPPHAGDAKLRPACPASVVIILLESTCPSYGQVRKSILLYVKHLKVL